jgi:hypothetical protein
VVSGLALRDCIVEAGGAVAQVGIESNHLVAKRLLLLGDAPR